ncbi:MAG: hypothetical protein Kow00109_11860 [Acidobacteriota bacterium]
METQQRQKAQDKEDEANQACNFPSALRECRGHGSAGKSLAEKADSCPPGTLPPGSVSEGLEPNFGTLSPSGFPERSSSSAQPRRTSEREEEPACASTGRLRLPVKKPQTGCWTPTRAWLGVGRGENSGWKRGVKP